MTEPESHDDDLVDGERPGSIFSMLWFRVLVVVVVLGAVAAIAVPYAVDVVQAPAPRTAAVDPPDPATSAAGVAAPAAPVQTPAPSAPPAAASSPAPASAGPTSTETASPPVARPSAAPAPRVAAKTPPATRPPVKARAKAAADTASAPRRTAAAESAAPAPTPAPTARNAGGDYWVQVGAFRDPAAARRLAARLREQGYTVDESLRQAAGEAPPASAASMPPAADRYLVFVSGASNDLATQLKARGLAAETAPGGVVLTPSRPLRDAVQLSRDLTADGLKVQVRRAGSAADAGPPASPPAPAASEGGAFHRIRVAGFSDRAAAEAAARELHARGYSPFVGQGAK